MATWELENVEGAARAEPQSFFIPPLAERHGQSVGDVVRLHFLLVNPGPDVPRAERMWVEVVEKTGDPPRYVGILQNDPRFISDLRVGDQVEFGPEHIAQTLIKRSDPRWFEAAEKQAMVSEMVFAEGEAIRFMYREPPDHDEDSGWRLFTGRETEDYLEDPKNTRLCSVGWLADFDQSLQAAIRGEVGTAFERASRTHAWTEVKDWKPMGD